MDLVLTSSIAAQPAATDRAGAAGTKLENVHREVKTGTNVYNFV